MENLYLYEIGSINDHNKVKNINKKNKDVIKDNIQNVIYPSVKIKTINTFIENSSFLNYRKNKYKKKQHNSNIKTVDKTISKTGSKTNSKTSSKTSNKIKSELDVLDNDAESNLKNQKLSNKLIDAKNQIDKFYRKKEWDSVKKITNPFEMIYITCKFNKMNSVALYEPLSRSYFKMIEMINEFLLDYNSIKYEKGIQTLHLAEGPGGFMEAFVNFRNNKNDIYYGMTLKSVNHNIPGWHKSTHFINKHTNLNIVTGIDNMGDLYNVNNHYYLINRFGRNKMDIITGDGGFDFSVDYNMQEQLAQKLIYSQMIMGFSMLKKGGTFICKFFDTFLNLTQEFIFLLYLFYEKVYIYKPYTSRLANSERYIVCRGYKGISTLYLTQLIQVLDLWNYFDNINQKKSDDYRNCNFRINSSSNCKNIITIKNILDFSECPCNSKINKYYSLFKEKLYNINNSFQSIQIENINKTINIIKFRRNNKWYNDNCKRQIKIAIQWCKKYNVPHKSFVYNFNYKSFYDL